MSKILKDGTYINDKGEILWRPHYKAQPQGWMHHKVFKMKVDHMGTERFQKNGRSKWHERPHPFKAGDLVRVVMTSRFGDVGITHNLKADTGYDARFYQKI